jgi:hypothetical protein
MEQTRGYLRPHALPERELAYRDIHKRAKAEPVHQRIARPDELVAPDAVDPRKELECVPGRQVIPQLRSLAEDRADPVSEFPPLAPGSQAEYAKVSRSRMENSCQHLDRGRFSGAVRPDQRHWLAGRNHQSDSVDGGDFRHRSAESAPSLQDEILLQVFDLDFVMHNPSSGKRQGGAANPISMIFLDSIETRERESRSRILIFAA